MKVRKLIEVDLAESEQIIGLIMYDHAGERITLRATKTTGMEELAALLKKVLPNVKFTTGEGNEI